MCLLDVVLLAEAAVRHAGEAAFRHDLEHWTDGLADGFAPPGDQEAAAWRLYVGAHHIAQPQEPGTVRVVFDPFDGGA
jgi:hypothetical protein